MFVKLETIGLCCNVLEKEREGEEVEKKNVFRNEGLKGRKKRVREVCRSVFCQLDIS